MFLHAVLNNRKASEPAIWHDVSTSTHFRFESPSGTLQLLKRSTYPATYAYCSGSIVKAGYGSETRARVTTKEDEVDYSNEYLHIELDCAASVASIKRDFFCTVPLFLTQNETLLSLSNRFDLACQPFTGLRLDTKKLYSFFTNGTVGRADTYIKECLPIGALENVEWRAGKLSQAIYPPPGFIPETMTSVNSGNDARTFRQFFDALMEEYASRYAVQPIACEFSGGIDSAMVAGYLADNGYDPLLLTVTFPGDFKQTQAVKINEFKERFHTRHHITDLDDPKGFPLSRMALNNTWHPFYQDEEIYFEAFHAHARYLAEQGVGVSFNGLGGDDVLARFDFAERQKEPPRFFTRLPVESRPQEHRSNDSFARVANQLVMQKFSCNNVYLELGIWPVAPFTDPRLFLYCQSLMPRYRDNKNIYRMYCQAWEYPESIYHPAINEDFSPYFKSYADRYLPAFAKQWLEAPVLSRLGLIDKDEALRYAQEPASDEERFQAYRLITTEINLQTLGVTPVS